MNVQIISEFSTPQSKRGVAQEGLHRHVNAEAIKGHFCLSVLTRYPSSHPFQHECTLGISFKISCFLLQTYRVTKVSNSMTSCKNELEQLVSWLLFSLWKQTTKIKSTNERFCWGLIIHHGSED